MANQTGVIEKITLGGKVCYKTGVKRDYKKLFIWPMGAQEKQGMGYMFEGLSAVLKDQKCLLAACEIEAWNDELSPWEGPAVFGREGFSGQGMKTLEWLVQDCISHFQRDLPGNSKLPVFIGGYSLAGLFALWAFHETGLFCGAASCSGSLWYPGFAEYVKSKEVLGERDRKQASIYLSLGIGEAKNKNPVLSTVKERTEALYGYYSSRPDVTAKLEWNPGGHFTEPGKRLLKGFRWLLEHTV